MDCLDAAIVKDEKKTPFALALCVGYTELAAAKGVRMIGGVELAIVICLAAILIVPLFLSAILFVSIVWTHRPDLSMVGILRECVKEIKNRKSR